MRTLGGDEQLFNEWSNLISNNPENSNELKLQKVNNFFNKHIKTKDLYCYYWNFGLDGCLLHFPSCVSKLIGWHY